MRIAVAGGGTENDSVSIDRCFAEWVGPDGRLLYLPIALGWPATRYEEASRWLRSVFSPLGIEHIHMWDRLEGHRPAELGRFTAIYIGGGNTYGLLHVFRMSGFDLAIADFACQGYPVYGGSAGAAVLGKDIGTIEHLDPNDVGLEDTRGLDLLAGSSVWIHFREDQRQTVDDYVRETGQSTIALSERSGVAYQDGSLRSFGEDSPYLVDGRGWTGVAT